MPRMPYLGKTDLPESQRHFYDEIDHNRAGLNVYAALLNSPEAATCVGALGSYLRFGSHLPPQTRELAILTVAREMRCYYEWAQHAPVARSAGVGEDWIRAVREGTAGQELPKDQALPLRYVEELVRRHSATDELFDKVGRILGKKELLDLTLLAGYYTMVAMAIRAIKVEVEADFFDEKDEQLFLKMIAP